MATEHRPESWVLVATLSLSVIFGWHRESSQAKAEVGVLAFLNKSSDSPFFSYSYAYSAFFLFLNGGYICSDSLVVLVSLKTFV